MNLIDHITVDPNVCHGQACIKGTRVPVSVILDSLASGMLEKDILDEYPTLPPQAVKAAVIYAAALAREEVLPIRVSNDALQTGRKHAGPGRKDAKKPRT